MAEQGIEKTWLKLRVSDIVREAEAIARFEFTDPANAPLPRFTAGAHVEVRVGDSMIRSYSLSNDPAEAHRYVVAVLREESGRGGSVAMHDRVSVGDILEVSTPCNRFPLAGDEAQFHLLLAGGIGVTPMMAMVHELEARGARWNMHYCTRSPERTAFLIDLAPHVAAGKVSVHHDEGDPARGLDIAATLSRFDVGTHLYFCGPPGFMSATKAAVGHWPVHTVHCEYFTAAEGAQKPAMENNPFEIRIRSTGDVFEVPSDKSIIDVLREHGHVIDSDCEDGYCGTCITRYLSGDPDHRDTVLSESERHSYMMICCSRAKCGTLELDL
jgi:ferredoxin-NADP reductase